MLQKNRSVSGEIFMLSGILTDMRVLFIQR